MRTRGISPISSKRLRVKHQSNSAIKPPERVPSALDRRKGRRNMTFAKNRNLLVGWAVLLFLAACGLLAAINLINTREVSMEMTGAAEQNLSAYIHDNVMTSLKESSTLLNQLDSPAFMSYSSSYANLLPADDAEAMRRDLAEHLKNLSLSPDAVQHDYFPWGITLTRQDSVWSSIPESGLMRAGCLLLMT